MNFIAQFMAIINPPDPNPDQDPALLFQVEKDLALMLRKLKPCTMTAALRRSLCGRQFSGLIDYFCLMDSCLKNVDPALLPPGLAEDYHRRTQRALAWQLLRVTLEGWLSLVSDNLILEQGELLKITENIVAFMKGKSQKCKQGLEPSAVTNARLTPLRPALGMWAQRKADLSKARKAVWKKTREARAKSKG